MQLANVIFNEVLDLTADVAFLNSYYLTFLGDTSARRRHVYTRSFGVAMMLLLVEAPASV